MAPDGPPRPPLLIRLAGQAISQVVVRAPILWPLLRGTSRRFWDRAAPGWAERVTPQRVAPLAAACDRLDGDPERILELGTGTGAGARMLAERFPGASIDAADLSPEMIETARSSAPERIRFAVADASALPYDDGGFDLVAQLNMPLFPSELVRVVRPGGHVIVASSLGPATPYYTPERLVRRRLAKLGVGDAVIGKAGAGTYLLARKTA
jgi:SAM-dependent methyltransferase